MRNILLILTLCVVSFSTLNANADAYDESKRMERMGLSFYDGAPMYLIYFSRPGGSQQSSYPNGATMMRVERLRSDQRLEDMSEYQKGYGYVWIGSKVGGTSNGICYGFDDDGSLEELEASDDLATSRWFQKLLREQGPGLIFQASGDDIALHSYDAISERLKPWLLPALGVALALFGVRYCYRLLVRMVQGENGVGLGGANENVVISRDDYGTSSNSVRPSFEVRDNLEQVDVSSADEYATGEAFGQKYSPKVVASNVDLQNEWARLSDDERSELLGDVLGGSPFGDRRGAWGDEEDER